LVGEERVSPAFFFLAAGIMIRGLATMGGGEL